MALSCRKIEFDSPVHAVMVDLRERVLRRPLGMQITQEEIARDADNFLLGCYDGEILVGCLILQREEGGWVRLRQVAVDEVRQGQGIGRFMLREAQNIAREWGTEKIYCHARENARRFYERGGWAVVGDTFSEVGIPHCRMEYTLEQTAAE